MKKKFKRWLMAAIIVIVPATAAWAASDGHTWNAFNWAQNPTVYYDRDFLGTFMDNAIPDQIFYADDPWDEIGIPLDMNIFIAGSLPPAQGDIGECINLSDVPLYHIYVAACSNANFFENPATTVAQAARNSQFPNIWDTGKCAINLNTSTYTNINWSNDDIVYGDQVDVRSVLIHELGHCMSMLHNGTESGDPPKQGGTCLDHTSDDDKWTQVLTMCWQITSWNGDPPAQQNPSARTLRQHEKNDYASIYE